MSTNPYCENIPPYLSTLNFLSGKKNYYEVEQKIQTYLRRNDITYTFEPEFCSFVCTQNYDSENERIDVINIYWNPLVETHVIEVRRLKGDILYQCSKSKNFHNIFMELKIYLTEVQPLV